MWAVLIRRNLGTEYELELVVTPDPNKADTGENEFVMEAARIPCEDAEEVFDELPH